MRLFLRKTVKEPWVNYSAYSPNLTDY